MTLPHLVGRARFAARQALREAWRWLRALVDREAPPVLHLFEAPTPGAPLRLLLSRPGLIEDRLVADRAWEPHIRDLIRFHLPARGVFVDVGANIGYHALSIACAFADARVLAFEPNPCVRAQLVVNRRLSRADNVDVFDCALGAAPGRTRFYAQGAADYNRGRSSLQRNADLGARIDAIDVECRTLDDVIGDGRVDIVKLDTQGTELAVLAGARRLIARFSPLIVLEFEAEYQGDARAAYRALESELAGYQLWRIHHKRAEISRFDPRDIRGARFKVDLVARPRR
ncbi:MAG TPA: FkbM family methyltransferase [Polyangia bacterium]|nr:FkbM family methyltransferase [Polyangia bacterium]